MPSLQEQFGAIDIYLFDQILRGRVTPGMQIFDAGCGGGRNLVYFLREGYSVAGCDPDPRSLKALRNAGADVRAEAVEANSFPGASADVVIASAVLHFAADDQQFLDMLRGAWRVLKPGGLFFARLASSIGIESQIVRTQGRRFRLPDGSDRYLVDAPFLRQLTQELGGTLLDPIKTTVVQDQRSMTTWVLRKN